MNRARQYDRDVLSLDFLHSSGNTAFDMSLLAECMPAFSWSSPF